MQNMMNTPTLFEPKNAHEEVTARVVRMMLKYEILRFQIEKNLIVLDTNQRAEKRQEAIQLRIDGFRTQRESGEKGMPFTYDDELLRREGIRIAYLLLRDATDEAKRIEEDVVAISVNKALYGMDDDLISFATAA